MNVQLPSWLERVPEPILFGGVLFIVMVAASLLAFPIVWFNNWRRLVPERFRPRDYLMAIALFAAMSFLVAVGAAVGLFLLQPLRRLGPGIAAIPGGIIVIILLVVVGNRPLRRDRG